MIFKDLEFQNQAKYKSINQRLKIFFWKSNAHVVVKKKIQRKL